jgi:hypothetical protein
MINKIDIPKRKPLAVGNAEKPDHIVTSSSRDSANMDIDIDAIHTQRINVEDGMRPKMIMKRLKFQGPPIRTFKPGIDNSPKSAAETEKPDLGANSINTNILVAEESLN